MGFHSAKEIRSTPSPKVGVVTWFGGPNMGSDVQAFALVRAIRDLGCNSFLLRLRVTPEKVGRLTNKLHLARRTAWESLNPDRRFISYHCENKVKQRKVCDFAIENIPAYDIRSHARYHTAKHLFDCVVCGSDQIWNPYHTRPFYLLQPFDPDLRVAYSSSIGVDEIPEGKIELYRKELSKFRHIAVREETAEQLVRDLTGKEDVTTVADPVFLLSHGEWMDIAAGSDAERLFAGRKFIFFYYVGENDFYRQQLEDIMKKTGIGDVIRVSATENTSIVFPGTDYRQAGPKDFLWLIENAEFVCTDSFHATALSIHFRKQFVELLRFSEGDSRSQNSRLRDMLARFGLEDRFYSEEETPAMIDYNEVTPKVEALIEHSKSYLRKALEK